MVKMLCDLLLVKLTNLKPNDKAAIFIGMIHLHHEKPVMNMIKQFQKDISFENICRVCVMFLKNNEELWLKVRDLF